MSVRKQENLYVSDAFQGTFAKFHQQREAEGKAIGRYLVRLSREGLFIGFLAPSAGRIRQLPRTRASIGCDKHITAFDILATT